MRKRRGRFSFQYGMPENQEEKRDAIKCFTCLFARGRRYSSQLAPLSELECRGLEFDADDDSDYIRKLRIIKEKDPENGGRVQWPHHHFSSSEGTVPARLVPRGRSDDRNHLPSVVELDEESGDGVYNAPLHQERCEAEFPEIGAQSEAGGEIYGTPDGLRTSETGGPDVAVTVGEQGQTTEHHGEDSGVPIPARLVSAGGDQMIEPEPLDLLGVRSVGTLPRSPGPAPRGEPTEPERSSDEPAPPSDASPNLSHDDRRTTRITNSAVRRGLREPLPSSSSNTASLNSNSEGHAPSMPQRAAIRQISPVYEDFETEAKSPPTPPFSPGSPPPAPPSLPPRPKSWMAAQKRKRQESDNESVSKKGKRSGGLMKEGELLRMARPTPGIRGEEMNL